MKQRPRINYTQSDKSLIWERWKEGASLHLITALFDRPHSSIRRILAESGGIRPPVRCRSQRTLSLAEREEISRALAVGTSIRTVATRLGRAPSTISREINRNGGQGCYRASQADQTAWERACRPKSCKLTENQGLAHIVASKLQCQWSPQQIAGWLKHAHKKYLRKHGTPNAIAELSSHTLISFDEETPFVRAASKPFPFWRREAFSIRTDSIGSPK